MAEPPKIPPLSNMDIIKLTKNIGRDEYYHLGKALGFAENILDHLWEADHKGCALQILLLWRDGLQAEDDQKAILADKLAEAGLEDKRDHLLHGFPMSPGPYPPSPDYSTTGMTTSRTNPARNNNDPSIVQRPTKQSRKSDQQPHPSANRSDETVTSPGRQLEHSDEENTVGGSNDAVFSLSNLRHSSHDDDSDSSDPENYINVSNKTLQRGSVSVAVIRSKPRLSFHSPEESNVSEQRQSLAMETGPLVSPSTLAADEIMTQEHSQQQLRGTSTDNHEALQQTDTVQDLATSIASSKDVLSAPDPVTVKPISHKPSDPHFQFKAPFHQNVMMTDNQSHFSSSQGETTLPHKDQDGSVEKPTKERPVVSPKPPLPRPKPKSSPLGLDPQNKNQPRALSPLDVTETLVDLQSSKGPSELPKFEGDLHPPPIVAQSSSSTEEVNEYNRNTYASIGMDETGPQPKTQGPPVAPYQPKTRASAFHQDATKEAADVGVPLNRKLSLPESPSKAPKTPPRKMSVPPKPVSTNDASIKKQGSSFPVHHAMNEDVLRALANDITTGEQLVKLGQELGFQEAEINGFEAMNQRGSPQSMPGTLEMLLKWRSKVSSEDESLLLKHALRRSGMVKMAETHLKASRRRRDIRNIKIAKHFTVSDCREKLEFHYRIDTCKILKKHEFLTAGNHLPVIFVHRLVRHGKNLHVEKVFLEGSIRDILRTRKDDALPTRIVIFGPSGVGKTTLLAQLAHDWAERVEGSPLQDVSLLFVLKMNFMNNHGSLGQAIVNQLLSDVRGLTPQGMDQFIEDNQSECLVLLDGLDEFKGEISSVKCGHVLRVIQNIQLRKCRVIVTSHPRLEDYFNKEDLPKDFLKMEIRGFSQLQSTSFVRTFFRENRSHKADELIVFLRMNYVINELMAIPLFCLLVCHLWESNLLQLVTTESEFYDSVHRFFLKHGEEKASTGAGDTDLELIVPGVGEVALNGVLEDPNKRAFGQSDFKKIPSMFEKACALGIISKGASTKRDDANFEFYHRNAQEHCAAKYLSRVVPSKSTKGKNSRLDKVLKQMTKRNLVDYGGILRFAAGLGSHAIRLQVLETIHLAENVQSGDKSRMVLDCLAEIPELDKQTSYVVEQCFDGGNLLVNLPTIHTTLGFYKLHPYVKEKLRSVKILSSSMPSHVGKSLSMGLQGCPDLLKLEVADVHNPTYPIILLLANKLSLHQSPEGALSVLSDLNQIVFNGLKLVNLSGCHLSPEATAVLWTTLARCPHIEVMTIKGTTILGRDLPRLRCVSVVQANLRSPVHQEEVRWLSSFLGDAQDSTEVRLTIGDISDGTVRRAGVGLQEHILMAVDRLDLTNATGNTIKVLSVLPDNYRKKVKTLCIKRTHFTEDLTRPLLETVHSLIRLETFTTEDCDLPDELKQLHVFKGSFHRHVHELPTMGPDGVVRGRVSSPIREEEFERLNSALTGTTSIQQVHLLIDHDRQSETDYQELLDITGDNLELCNVSSATIEILRILPTSFKQQIHCAHIRNCNLNDELSQLLSDTLQSMGELEMFLSDNSILSQKALHMRSVTVLKLGCFSSKCFDWEWLENALLLEELHLTFASSAPTTPTSPKSFSLPVVPSTPSSPTSSKGAAAGAATPIGGSGPVGEDLPSTSEAAAAGEASEEDFFLQLTYGRLVMTKMSLCSLSVMLHLPKHMKNELRHVRIRSTKLTVDLLNKLADVRRSFRHLSSLSLEALYRRPIKYGCILQPESFHPVVGQRD